VDSRLHSHHAAEVIPNQFDDGDESRVGFERMLNNEDEEWSQMARVKKLMVEEDSIHGVKEDSMNGVNKLALAMAAVEEAAVEDATSKECVKSNDASSDGLAMLVAGAARENEEASSSRAPIMASVFERADAPPTPSKQSSSIPTLSSPGARSGSCSTAFKGGSPFKSPGNTMLWGSTISMGGGDSHHFEGSYGFDISDRSRQAFGNTTTASKTFGSTGLTPETSRMDQDGSNNNTNSSVTAMTAADEARAILALNSLSNSPGRFTLASSSMTGDDRNSNMGGVKRSLFDKVVTGARKKRK